MAMSKEERKRARRLSNWKYNLKTSYGISENEYYILIENQNNKCAICKSEDLKRNGINQFIVDHDHKTGNARGLLCDKCNKLLGAVKDNIQTLKNMNRYLNK